MSLTLKLSFSGRSTLCCVIFAETIHTLNCDSARTVQRIRIPFEPGQSRGRRLLFGVKIVLLRNSMPEYCGSKITCHFVFFSVCSNSFRMGIFRVVYCELRRHGNAYRREKQEHTIPGRDARFDIYIAGVGQTVRPAIDVKVSGTFIIIIIIIIIKYCESQPVFCHCMAGTQN